MLPGITVAMIRPVAITWSYAVGGDAKPPEILRQIPGVVSDSRLRCPNVSARRSFGTASTTYRRPRPAIGISRKLIAVNSLIKQPCLHGLGRHPFRDLSGLGSFPAVISRRLRWYLSAPSPKKCLLPLHFGLPCGSAVVYRLGRSR
jgi:hypothetical protein